jgi:hypothetical protein
MTQVETLLLLILVNLSVGLFSVLKALDVLIANTNKKEA